MVRSNLLAKRAGKPSGRMGGSGEGRSWRLLPRDRKLEGLRWRQRLGRSVVTGGAAAMHREREQRQEGDGGESQFGKRVVGALGHVVKMVNDYNRSRRTELCVYFIEVRIFPDRRSGW